MDSQLLTWVLGFVLAIFGAGFSVFQFASKKNREAYLQDLKEVKEAADTKIQAAKDYAVQIEKNAEREIKRLEKDTNVLVADMKDLRKEVYREFVSKDEMKEHSRSMSRNFKELFDRLNDLTKGIGEVKGFVATKTNLMELASES